MSFDQVILLFSTHSLSKKKILHYKSIFQEGDLYLKFSVKCDQQEEKLLKNILKQKRSKLLQMF